MICCHSCPFHPVNGFAKRRCRLVLCRVKTQQNHQCIKMPVTRCFFDLYVIRYLYQKDFLAESLAETVFKKALHTRDRALLLALFHAADSEIRERFWQWFEQSEPRSLWLLNPVFAGAGLLPIASFADLGTRRDLYFQALSSNPYSGKSYQTICSHLHTFNILSMTNEKRIQSGGTF